MILDRCSRTAAPFSVGTNATISAGLPTLVLLLGPTKAVSLSMAAVKAPCLDGGSIK
jgi:hypothetical protein